ncbi:MAG: type VII toxin-antitoxin system HepT family RNase toxin [Gammaproteobacteria bacterium]
MGRYLARIEQKCPTSASLLAADPDAQDIVVLNLSRAVQLCVDIGSHLLSDTPEQAPRTMGEVFATLSARAAISPETAERLRRAVGFRNIAVHNYERIDWEVVHAIATRFLDDFRRFASEVGCSSGLA